MLNILVKIGFHQIKSYREKFYEIRGPCKHLWRKMTIKDIPKVTKILQEYNEKFKIAPIL